MSTCKQKKLMETNYISNLVHIFEDGKNLKKVHSSFNLSTKNHGQNLVENSRCFVVFIYDDICTYGICLEAVN